MSKLVWPLGSPTVSWAIKCSLLESIESCQMGKPLLSRCYNKGRFWKFIGKFSNSEHVIWEQEDSICKSNDGRIYCQTIKTSSLRPTKLTFVWSCSQMEMVPGDSWQHEFWDDTKCVWELAKTNLKRGLRSGFSLPLFDCDGVGVGAGARARGGSRGKVTWEMLVKVSPGQAWGEQWHSVVVGCLHDLDILPMSV